MALMEIALPFVALLAVVLVIWGAYGLLVHESQLAHDRLAKYDVSRSGVILGVGNRPAPDFEEAEAGSPLFRDRSYSTIWGVDRILRGMAYSERVALDLARAAVPLRVGEYLLLRWIAAVVLFFIPYLFRMPWFLDILFGLLGFYAPRMWLSGRERARVRRIEDQLVDALSMMSNSLRAGASFLQAAELVARELPAPISQEFALVLAEVGVGAPVNQSLEDLSRRVRSYDMYLVTTAMIIQRTVGGNLSEVLQNIAHTIRERQRLLRQVQVETSEQRLSAYILLALPVFMLFLISIINRTYVDSLLQPGMGRFMLGGALVLQIIGYLMMRRISNIRV